VQYQRFEQGHTNTLEQTLPTSTVQHKAPPEHQSHHSSTATASLEKQKYRCRKLEKRLQKVTLRDMQNQNTII
jgi:hypothetical protein